MGIIDDESSIDCLFILKKPSLEQKLNEQWERCLVYLEQFSGVKKDCNIYNTEYCPMKCNYAIKQKK